MRMAAGKCAGKALSKWRSAVGPPVEAPMTTTRAGLCDPLVGAPTPAMGGVAVVRPRGGAAWMSDFRKRKDRMTWICDAARTLATIPRRRASVFALTTGGKG